MKGSETYLSAVSQLRVKTVSVKGTAINSNNLSPLKILLSIFFLFIGGPMDCLMWNS